ncbi:hypothetical protein BHE74_00010869 [Ensete ventricosum]|nr:hypothetical protein BHE74_00010869 [Ensete ventricosum]
MTALIRGAKGEEMSSLLGIAKLLTPLSRYKGEKIAGVGSCRVRPVDRLATFWRRQESQSKEKAQLASDSPSVLARAFPSKVAHLATVVTGAVTTTAPTAVPPAPAPASAPASLVAIPGEMTHLTTVIASTATAAATSATSATAAAAALIAILSKMPGLTASIASPTATKPSAGPSPPTTSPTSTVKPESSTVTPAAHAAAAATTVPVPPATAATATATATAAAALDVGSIGPGDIDCLGAAVVALGHHEFDDLALGERAVALGLDGRLVDEEILPAVVRRDKAEPLGVVEPLHRPP